MRFGRNFQPGAGRNSDNNPGQGPRSEQPGLARPENRERPGSEVSDSPELILDSETQLVTVDDDSPSISVLWDRAVQQTVINESPGPTVASRAYGIVHTAMFDAWAAYDPDAIATQLGDDLPQETSEKTVANKTEAMSARALPRGRCRGNG